MQNMCLDMDVWNETSVSIIIRHDFSLLLKFNHKS